MEKITSFIVGIWLILISSCTYAQSDNRTEFDLILQQQVGVREHGGQNRGEKVTEYIRSTGFQKPVPWCAALMYWGGKQIGKEFDVKYPALSAAYFYDNDKIVWKRGTELKRRPQKGDFVGFYFRSKGRIAHIGELHDWMPGTRYVITIEGNTNGRGSREGDGVYIRMRRKEEIYMISSHFKN